MKNFMNKIRHKSIIVLLSLLSAIFLLAATFTVSKYVIEKRAGTLLLDEMPLATTHHTWDKKLYGRIITQNGLFFNGE